MIEQSLDGTWQLTEAGTSETIAAAVPGGVHEALLAAGRIPEPFVADNELRVQWVAERDWEFRRHFTVDAGVASRSRIALVFDGIDTLAEVRLNGEPIGSADNMFRRWRWDVTGRLSDGENEVTVAFRSAVRYAAELHAVRPLPSANDQLPGAPYVRKAPCHFGWDWGPKLPNVGLWQSVRLEGWDTGRVEDVRLEQRLDASAGHVTARLEMARDEDAALVARLRVTGPDGRAVESSAPVEPVASSVDLEVAVDDPELWWPNGLGGQPLYRVDVTVERAPAGSTASARPDALDARTFELGFRTIELRQAPDEFGRSFTFVVNGVPIFAKGSNWIPADTFPVAADPARVNRLLEAAAAGNQNMIRVWGGGYYETEAFYDACDRLGLLVWHDLMFACSVYPLTDPAFVANVREEVRQQVARLRHRACLALWCGNNEMEMGWWGWGWSQPNSEDLREAYLGFFDRLLPGWIREGDTATPYWPSSPSSGRPLVEPIGDRTGDDHQWLVWHGLKPFSNYTEKTQRFVSEFGFESLPDLRTVTTMAPEPADWDLGSPMLDHHQRSPIGNSRILFYLGQHFRLPKDFDSLVYVSQLVQAEALRVGIEHWRRGRDRCSGALYWQLDDCWPVVSWSTIDYFGRWKAGHYVTRRAFALLLLSCTPESDGSVGIYVTNDGREPWSGEVAWSLESLDGVAVAGARGAAMVGGAASARVAGVPASVIPTAAEERRAVVVVAELRGTDTDGLGAIAVLPLEPDKHLALADPHIEARVEPAAESGAAVVRLVSKSLARWVELRLEGADVVFGDDYFDLPAGQEVAVRFALPDGWNVAQAQEALRIRTIVDTYRA